MPTVCALVPMQTERMSDRACRYCGQMSLDGYLLVDPPSMAALHILQEERHPSKMGIGQSKEGFSLLAMLNSCVGVPGRRLMRLWFLRPIIDLQVCFWMNCLRRHVDHAFSVSHVISGDDLMAGVLGCDRQSESLSRLS